MELTGTGVKQPIGQKHTAARPMPLAEAIGGALSQSISTGCGMALPFVAHNLGLYSVVLMISTALFVSLPYRAFKRWQQLGNIPLLERDLFPSRIALSANRLQIKCTAFWTLFVLLWAAHVGAHHAVRIGLFTGDVCEEAMRTRVDDYFFILECFVDVCCAPGRSVHMSLLHHTCHVNPVH